MSEEEATQLLHDALKVRDLATIEQIIPLFLA